MKVKIEVLKAPWPAGAKAGDVVEIAGDRIPASLIGKCASVSDEAPVTIAYPAAELAEEKTEEKKKAAK